MLACQIEGRNMNRLSYILIHCGCSQQTYLDRWAMLNTGLQPQSLCDGKLLVHSFFPMPLCFAMVAEHFKQVRYHFYRGVMLKPGMNVIAPRIK